MEQVTVLLLLTIFSHVYSANVTSSSSSVNSVVLGSVMVNERAPVVDVYLYETNVGVRASDMLTLQVESRQVL
jgi:hypothetical protein